MKAKMLTLLLILIVATTAKAEEKDIFGVISSNKLVEKTITVKKLSDKVIEINKKQYLVVGISEYLENNKKISRYFIKKNNKTIEVRITKEELIHNGRHYKRI